jgi:hypothetical protein
MNILSSLPLLLLIAIVDSYKKLEILTRWRSSVTAAQLLCDKECLFRILRYLQVHNF